MMKNLFAFWAACLLYVSVNAQFTDDFSDGDFTQNPEWFGDTALFTVNAQDQLQLNDSVTNESYLATRSRSILNAEWEFYVKMDFNPSGSNYCRVYLISDAPDLTGSLNGYHVRIGGFSGSADHVSLYRQTGTNSTQIIKGADGTVTQSPELMVRVTRDSAGTWELEIDTALSGNYVSEGTAFDDQHTLADYFGVRCRYTSTRAQLIFFDDFNVTGNIIPDTIPPQLDSAAVLTNTSVELHFNEELDPATAVQVTNYQVNNGVGTPANATLGSSDPSKVTLFFTPPLTDMTRYTVTVNGVEDLAGNPANNQTAQFVLFTPQSPDEGDVIINEIMSNSSPSAGLPEVEYVELFNTSAKAFQLNGWIFRDNARSAEINSYALLPGEYVVLLDEDDLSEYPDLNNKVGVPSMPVLRISDDEVSIRTPQGLILDTLHYRQSWYRDSDKSGGGYSLELINPRDPCSNRFNWIASETATGGTPGTQNSVYDTTPDTDAPELTGYEVVSEIELLLIFNKTLDPASADAANFTSDPAAGTVERTGDFNDRLLLTFIEDLDSAEVYTLTYKGITDCWGNTSGEEVLDFALGKNARPHDLIFNEIHHNPDDELGNLPDEKFTELHNTADYPVRLGNLTFSDRTSSQNLPNDVAMPGEYLIITSNDFAEAYRNFGRVISFSSGPSPNVNDDDLLLSNVNGTVIDQISYSRQWHSGEAGSGGISLERINPFDFCEGRNNWASSEAERGGTPGTENSIFNPDADVEVPQITGVIVTEPDVIELRFNRRMNLIVLQNADYLISPNVGIDSVAVNPEFPSRLTIYLGEQLQTGNVYEAAVSGAEDCAGVKVSGDHAFMEFVVPEPKTLLINEVLFNPRTGGSRFIELYNPNTHPVAITGWRFDYTNTAGNPASLVIEGNYTVESKGYLALTDDPENIAEEYPDAVTENVHRQDMPTMRNSQGRVIIVSTLSDTIDDFSYNADFHFELLRELSGVSLERLSPERPTNDETNWHSASATVNFATPGYTNSQSAALETEKDQITLSPETFSPDNDGYNDVLNIGYELSEPGYVANIKIYDTYGRQIRNLAQNKLLDRRGAVTWNGVNDNGEKADIGIHIVYVELFDLEGNIKHFKKVCVVAGKL